MPVLVISTRRGGRHEAEVRNIHDAEREINLFCRVYLPNHPGDSIIDASVVSRGCVIARYRNGRIEDF